jgi:uncharacterized membrane-anchored protein
VSEWMRIHSLTLAATTRSSRSNFKVSHPSRMKFLRLFAIALLALPLARAATDLEAAASNPATAPAAEAPATRGQRLEQAGVKMLTGPATVPLGKVAELKLPAGYAFVGADSLDRFYELTQNVRNGNELGVLIAPKDWMLFFDYDDVGHVKDDEKGQLDADKLMQSMTAGQDSANEARKKRGWDAMKMQGWATPPHYDEKTHNLKWAFNLSSSRDNFKDVWINENIRLLGRSGVVNVTLVTGGPTFKASEAEADQLLATNFNYVAGQKYSEFKAGDKVAKYGLAALVLGGAGVVAAKAGLLANLGIFFAKAWKVIVVAVLAAGGYLVRLWKKIIGKDEVK